MSKKRFGYSHSIINFETGETVSQPLLNVVVRHERQVMPISMLVDSGGWDTLLHADLAGALGINLEECPTQTLGGITGKVDGYVHTITIEMPQTGDKFDVEAIFVPGLGTTSILGQKDFFPRYYVEFDKSNSGFYLTKNAVLKF